MPDLEIRDQIRRYIAHQIDAPALEDWLEDYSWEDADPAESLGPIALRLLAERANGDWTDDELRDELAALSRTYEFNQARNGVSADPTAQVIRHDLRSVAAETQRVAGFA